MTPTMAVLSVRNHRPRPWYAHIRATEDLFLDATGGVRHDLVVSSARVRENRWARRALRTAKRWPSSIDPDPASGPAADVGVMWASDLGDVDELLDVAATWVDFARTRVLVVSECWPGDLTLHGPKVRALVELFDAVFVCMENDCLAPVAGPTTALHHLPHAAVTESYRPRLDGDRPIGVMSYGRRDPDQHDALRAWSEGTGGWYHFDTASLGPTPDPIEHQRVLGRMLSASTFSVCNLGRFDEPHRTGGARELGARFYEALAAGCVLLGDFPESPMFDAHFGGLPGMTEFALGAGEVPDEVDRLLADRSLLGSIQRAHRAAALAHHDIAHRVAEILSVVDVEVPPRLLDRQADLRRQANALTDS